MAEPNEMIANRALPWRRLCRAAFGATVGLITMLVLAIVTWSKPGWFYVSLGLGLIVWITFSLHLVGALISFRRIKTGRSARCLYDMHVEHDRAICLGPIETGTSFTVLIEPCGLEVEASYETRMLIEILNSKEDVIKSMTLRKSHADRLWGEMGVLVNSTDIHHTCRLTMSTSTERNQDFKFDLGIEISTKKSLPKLPERWETTNV